MGLIRQSALLQMPTNNNGLVTASNAREVFGVVEDCLNDAVLDLTTLINNIQTGVNAVGNLGEIQFKGISNTLQSSFNFKYDTNNNLLDIKENSRFTLPGIGTKNFIITKDILAINNLLQIDSTFNNIVIGAIDSTIKLQRGSSTLDESLTLSENLLDIQNTNVTIKSIDPTVGNALEVRNSANTPLLQVTNTGEVRVKGIYGITNNVNNRIVFETAGYNYRTQIGGINAVEIYSGQANIPTALRAEFTSARSVFYTPLIIDSVRTKLIDPTDPLQTQFTYDLTLKGSDGALGGTSKSVFIQDGKPHTDAIGAGYGGTGVKLQSWQKQTGTTPILRTLIEVKEGDKIAFYGATPIAKQSLPTNPTNAQLATVLSNLGLVNLI